MKADDDEEIEMEFGNDPNRKKPMNGSGDK